MLLRTHLALGGKTVNKLVAGSACPRGQDPRVLVTCLLLRTQLVPPRPDGIRRTPSSRPGVPPRCCAFRRRRRQRLKPIASVFEDEIVVERRGGMIDEAVSAIAISYGPTLKRLSVYGQAAPGGRVLEHSQLARYRERSLHAVGLATCPWGNTVSRNRSHGDLPLGAGS